MEASLARTSELPPGGRGFISVRRALLVAAMLLLAGCSSSTGSSQAASPTPSPSPTSTSITGAIGAATYRIEVPNQWNGTLFLYSHGYVAPGHINLAADSPFSDIGAWMLGQGFAIAGSSYSSTGWAAQDGSSASRG